MKQLVSHDERFSCPSCVETVGRVEVCVGFAIGEMDSDWFYRLEQMGCVNEEVMGYLPAL